MEQDDKERRFREAVLPHLSAANNLARWLVHDAHDADDIVQDAYLRAFRFFEGFRGSDGRAWLLTIVRKRCYSWLRKRTLAETAAPFDEQLHSPGPGMDDDAGIKTGDPAVLFARLDDTARLNRAIEGLPLEFREALILRELEDLSYKQIAAVTGAPIGTVMSRLARGRKLLLQRLRCAEPKNP